MESIVIMRNTYYEWARQSPAPSAVTYEPSRLGVRILSNLAKAGGVSRRQFIVCGDQLLQQLFENDCIMWGHYLGEIAAYITPMGLQVLGTYADKGYVMRKVEE